MIHLKHCANTVSSISHHVFGKLDLLCFMIHFRRHKITFCQKKKCCIKHFFEETLKSIFILFYSILFFDCERKQIFINLSIKSRQVKWNLDNTTNSQVILMLLRINEQTRVKGLSHFFSTRKLKSFYQHKLNKFNKFNK